MTNASTKLRALEWEIGKLADVPSSIRQFRKSKLCDEAITIAKELEAERDDWRKRAEEWRLSAFEKKNHEATLRTENATLKRRLDEAMKELEVSRNTIAALQIRRQYGSTLDSLI